MNTLDDLRATLAVHSARSDDGLLDRADAVRSRVRVVRRRRRVSTVVGAVAAVALVAAGVTLPRLVLDRAESDIAATTTVAWGGFEYALVKEVEGDPGQRRLDVELPRSDRDQVVVLLAEDLRGGSATLGTEQAPADGGELLDRLVEDGAGAPLSVASFQGDDLSRMPLVATISGGTAATRVAVAVYRRTDAMPAGLVDPTHSSVFREQVGGRRLLTAAFVEPGRAEATIRFTGALAELRLADFCSVPAGGSPRKGPWVNVSIDGDGAMSSECGSPAEDASLGTSYEPEVHEVRSHTARIWTSTTQGGEPVPVAGAVVGLAAYSPGATVQVHGSTIDRVVEFDGRRWTLDDVIDSGVGVHRIVARWTNPTGHLLVGYVTEGTRRVRTGGTIQGGGFVDGTAATAAETRSSSLVGIVLPGADARFTVSWPTSYAGASGAVLVYRPAD